MGTGERISIQSHYYSDSNTFLLLLLSRAFSKKKESIRLSSFKVWKWSLLPFLIAVKIVSAKTHSAKDDDDFPIYAMILIRRIKSRNRYRPRIRNISSAFFTPAIPSRQERALITCPGIAGYCSEGFVGDLCIFVCAFGRPNAPVCQVRNLNLS